MPTPQEEILLLGLGSGATVDANGWPTQLGVQEKLQLAAPDGLTANLTSDISTLITTVIAEFESPVGPNGDGGTGRRFTPAALTRTYDGNGYPELRVEDIVPGTALTVQAWGTTLPDVVLQSNYHGLGYNILARPQGGGLAGAAWGGWNGQNVFPLGRQNISVTATFGYAATVPADVAEAVRCEVARRAMIQGAVNLTGVGEIVTIGDFNINTSAGVSVWKESSPLAMWKDVYQGAIARYRDSGTWRRARLAKRMS